MTFHSRRKARARKKVKSLWPLTGINVLQPVGAALPVGRRRCHFPPCSNSLRGLHEFTTIPGGSDPLRKTKLLTKIGAFMKCQALIKHSCRISGINASQRTRRNTDDLCSSFTRHRYEVKILNFYGNLLS